MICASHPNLSRKSAIKGDSEQQSECVVVKNPLINSKISKSNGVPSVKIISKDGNKPKIFNDAVQGIYYN